MRTSLGRVRQPSRVSTRTCPRQSSLTKKEMGRLTKIQIRRQGLEDLPTGVHLFDSHYNERGLCEYYGGCRSPVLVQEKVQGCWYANYFFVPLFGSRRELLL